MRARWAARRRETRSRAVSGCDGGGGLGGALFWAGCGWDLDIGGEYVNDCEEEDEGVVEVKRVKASDGGLRDILIDARERYRN